MLKNDERFDRVLQEFNTREPAKDYEIMAMAKYHAISRTYRSPLGNNPIPAVFAIQYEDYLSERIHANRG